jgi:hypothetical protein
LLADLGSDLRDDRLNALKRGEIPWIALSLRSINIPCSLPINSSARLAAPWSSLASAFSTFCTSLERTHSSVLLSELLFKRTNIDNINNNIRWVSVGTGSRLETADDGGSNGYRVRLWKIELQKLADELKRQNPQNDAIVGRESRAGSRTRS